MPKVGLEPTLLMEHDFESCVSANSTTRARWAVYHHAQDGNLLTIPTYPGGLSETVLTIISRITLLSLPTSGDALAKCLKCGGGINELAVDSGDDTGLSAVSGIPSLKVRELGGLLLSHLFPFLLVNG